MSEKPLEWLPIPEGADCCLLQYMRDLEHELFITFYGLSWVCCGRFYTDQDLTCGACGHGKPRT